MSEHLVWFVLLALFLVGATFAIHYAIPNRTALVSDIGGGVPRLLIYVLFLFGFVIFAGQHFVIGQLLSSLAETLAAHERDTRESDALNKLMLSYEQEDRKYVRDLIAEDNAYVRALIERVEARRRADLKTFRDTTKERQRRDEHKGPVFTAPVGP